MKINAQYRLKAASKSTVSADVAFDFFCDHDLDRLEEYKIDSDSYAEFVHENNALNALIKKCISDSYGVTGDLTYDLGYYEEQPSRDSVIDFMAQIHHNYAYMLADQRVFDVLHKEYLNLVKTKYRKYVYPILDTYYYDQVFPEFNGFDPNGAHEKLVDEYGRTGNISVLDDYVKSTGFR